MEDIEVAIHWKCVIFVVIFALFLVIMEYYRRYPFLSLYSLSLCLLGIPLSIYSGNELADVLKTCLLITPFITVSLWRISWLSAETLADHITTFKLNAKFHGVIRGKISSKFMEWFCAIMLFLNILWAVYIDFSSESYFNAGCGVLVALTVPLPSTLHQNIPGWTIRVEGDSPKKFDLMVTDNDWWWIGVYTSWNWLFAWTYLGNIWRVALPLGTPLVYSVAIQSPTRWVMVRTIALYLIYCLFYPWQWFVRVLGQSSLEDTQVIGVWGAVNLGLAVLYVFYYIHRLYGQCKGHEEENKASDMVTGTNEDVAGRTVSV